MMLNTLEAEASVPADIYLNEPAVLTTGHFTGVRAVVLNGVAHLLFYAEQPSACGDVEHIIVARLVAPEMRAAERLTRAAVEIAKGPTAINRPAN